MPPLSTPAAPLATLRRRLHAAGASHETLVAEVLERALRSPQAAHVFTALHAEGALAAARAADAEAHHRDGPGEGHRRPLAGLPISVKDLFDIAGEPTLAGSAVLRGAAPAAADAPAVQRLRAAGAAIVGRTNMTEFAFSGVGINPHYGTPHNPAAAAIDGALPRVPGGSSSGAAVSVALGLAVAGLGSDTGGSIRIPAALNGLVGFKNTQARTPLAGAYPLAPSLDTVCAMALSVEDCLLVDGVLAGAPLVVPRRDGVRGLKLALPRTLMLDALEPLVARAFERALARLAAAGATVQEMALAELAQIATINSPGGLTPVQAYATHRELFAARRAEYDPRVAARIALGENVLAADYIVLQRRRADWITRVTTRLAGFDALVCPTVPIVAPPIAPLEPRDAASDEAFFRVNGLLLRNTFAINFLDGCSFSLPCHEPGDWPVGLMLSAPGGHDAALAGAALAVEALLAARR